MIKTYHLKIRCVFLCSIIVLCNNDAKAMIGSQSSAIPTIQSQQTPQRSNSYSQNGVNNASGIISLSPVQTNSAIATENVSGQFTQMQLQPTIGAQPINSHNHIKMQTYNSPDGKKTCLEAMQSSLNNGISDNYCILDLSNTTDFAQNADLVTQQFFTQIQTKGIKYIYMDLYNSSVNDAYISKWSAQFKQAGMQVLWNLSGNKTVSDQTIVLFGSLDNILGLNIAGTAVTDIGATQLVSMLSSVNPVYIDFINVYRTNISDVGRAMLETKFNENASRWNAINPNKKIGGRGIINDLGLNIDKQSATMFAVATTQNQRPGRSQWNHRLGQSLINSAVRSVTSANDTGLQQYPVVQSATGINQSDVSTNISPISASHINVTAQPSILNSNLPVDNIETIPTNTTDTNINPAVVNPSNNGLNQPVSTFNDVGLAQAVEPIY